MLVRALQILSFHNYIFEKTMLEVNSIKQTFHSPVFGHLTKVMSNTNDVLQTDSVYVTLINIVLRCSRSPQYNRSLEFSHN